MTSCVLEVNLTEYVVKTMNVCCSRMNAAIGYFSLTDDNKKLFAVIDLDDNKVSVAFDYYPFCGSKITIIDRHHMMYDTNDPMLKAEIDAWVEHCKNSDKNQKKAESS